MKRPYQFAGVAFLLFAAFALNESRKLKYYSSLGPGPGFFPFWVSLFIGILALVMLYEASWKPQEPMPAAFNASRMGYVRSASILVALILMVATIERLGFRLAMLYEATWKSQEPMPADFIASRMGYVRCASILVALILMVVTIERLGFRLAMFGFYLFLLVALGRRNIFVTIAIALAGSFGIFYVFAEWLKIPLPVGVFGL